MRINDDAENNSMAMLTKNRGSVEKPRQRLDALPLLHTTVFPAACVFSGAARGTSDNASIILESLIPFMAEDVVK